MKALYDVFKGLTSNMDIEHNTRSSTLKNYPYYNAHVPSTCIILFESYLDLIEHRRPFYHLQYKNVYG